MATMKSAEEFKQEALQAIKDLGGFPYNPDIYWSYRAVKDIPVWKELYFHPARGDGKSMQWMEQWMEERAYEDIKNTFGEKSAEEAKRYCEKMSDLIDRQAAIDTLESGKDKVAKGDIGGFYNAIIQNDIDKLKNLPSAQQKSLKYSGDSICNYCVSSDCAGCVYEPMKG